MNYSSVLKIELNNQTVLTSLDAVQELYPINKHSVLRSISSTPIECHPQDIKYKCIIEAKDAPNTTLLKLSQLYKIYSIVKFKCDGNIIPNSPYVSDSIEHTESGTLFRPILNMYLTNFKCQSNNSGNTTWKLEFESV